MIALKKGMAGSKCGKGRRELTEVHKKVSKRLRRAESKKLIDTKSKSETYSKERTMKTQVVSWTNTVVHLLKGAFNLNDLQDVVFNFSCKKEHVLNEMSLPFEATWANETLPRADRRSNILIDHVDQDKRERVLALISLIKQADEEGRVNWGTGNQLEFLEALPPNTPVIYDGIKTTAGFFINV